MRNKKMRHAKRAAVIMAVVLSFANISPALAGEPVNTETEPDGKQDEKTVTVYVDKKNGSDQKDGTSEKAAVKTISKALSLIHEGRGRIILCGDTELSKEEKGLLSQHEKIAVVTKAEAEGDKGESNTATPTPTTEADKGENNTATPTPTTEADKGESNTATPTPTTGGDKGESNTATPTPTTEADKGESNTATPTPTTEADKGESNTATPTPTTSGDKTEGSSTGAVSEDKEGEVTTDDTAADSKDVISEPDTDKSSVSAAEKEHGTQQKDSAEVSDTEESSAFNGDYTTVKSIIQPMLAMYFMEDAPEEEKPADRGAVKAEAMTKADLASAAEQTKEKQLTTMASAEQVAAGTGTKSRSIGIGLVGNTNDFYEQAGQNSETSKTENTQNSSNQKTTPTPTAQGGTSNNQGSQTSQNKGSSTSTSTTLTPVKKGTNSRADVKTGDSSQVFPLTLTSVLALLMGGAFGAMKIENKRREQRSQIAEEWKQFHEDCRI